MMLKRGNDGYDEVGLYRFIIYCLW